MNPKDIMTDAIHNFHPQYQQYTQYSSGKKIRQIKFLDAQNTFKYVQKHDCIFCMCHIHIGKSENVLYML